MISNGNGKTDHRRQEVQQAVKNACDQLNSDGVAPRDYVEQLAWLFFLKAFDEAETRHEQEAAFDDKMDRRFSACHRPLYEQGDGRRWRHKCIRH